jgi:UDP-2,3-diacylglucosamine hydrolase
MTAALPRFTVLTAPPSWGAVDFISDLHLHAAEPATFDAWQDFMRTTDADAVFILGDLFEVWIGDDAAAPGSFEARCAEVLRQTARTRALYFMHGNRDFLLGPAFASEAGLTLLADPTVLAFAGRRVLLTHGDLLCLDDTDYLRFRAEVRAPDWQANFLARPLAEREGIARGMRAQSEARKSSGVPYADVDVHTGRQWLAASGATVLLHGHTHKPGDHALEGGQERRVLSDWDAAAHPPRAEVLRLAAAGFERRALA